MWHFFTKSNLIGGYIIAYSGEFVNDLQLFFKNLFKTANEDITKKTGYSNFTMPGLKVVSYFK